MAIASISPRSNRHLTTLDLSSKNLRKIDKLPSNISFNIVRFDHNEIIKIEHIDTLTHLIELSISHNRLIDIRLLSRLQTLQKLDLSHNSLDSLDCLKTLHNLVIINLSSNNIHSLSALNSCQLLQSIDASDNSIRQVDDLSQLPSLKYLNLHKNLIDTLISIPKFWPKSLQTLILSDNEIQDLTEISCLSILNNLNTLAVHDNPCLFLINERYGCHQPFDHRPFVLNWILSLQFLDELPVTRKENLKAEWLLSQGKGRSFRLGEHHELIQYLIKICGTNTDDRDDLHLSRIMFQQDQLISESEFVHLSSSSSLINSTNRYSEYDNRPIKPLDQNIFQSKLNQFPIDQTKSKYSAHEPSISKTKLNKRHTIAEPIVTNIKSAPIHRTENVDITKLTQSVEKIRTSMLKAYLELHERFTRTTELQTSALIALWKKYENEKQTYQDKTQQLLNENHLLNQRLQILETHLNNLHPPLRAYISKRDSKSFILHWLSNPLNSQINIQGYRIYINDELKLTIDSEQTEAIIDCIKEEGDYRIKIRTFNQFNESEDSNILVMRYRRQELNEQMKIDENLISPSLSIDSTTSKRSGIMSRIHRNNALLNALPMNQIGSFDMSSKSSLE